MPIEGDSNTSDGAGSRVWSSRLNNPAIVIGPTLLIALLCWSPVTCGQEAGGEWKETKSSDGNFRALLPGEAQYQSQQLRSEAGKITMHVYAAERDGTAFMVLYNDYPTEHVNKVGAANLLKQSQEGVVASAKGQLSREPREIKLGKHPGREFRFTVETPAGKVNSAWRIYLVGNRLYQTGVVAVGKETVESDVKTFGESFKLLQGQ
jgi:hypothetical protein